MCLIVLDKLSLQNFAAKSAKIIAKKCKILQPKNSNNFEIL